MAEKTAVKPLGQRLLDAGLINDAQLKLALNEHKRKGIYLGDALEELKILSQDIIAKFLAQETLSELVDLSTYPIEIDAVKLIVYDTAKQHQVLPLKKDGHTLTVAMADALDVNAIDAVGQETGLTIEVVAAPKTDIMEAIERHFAHKSTIEKTIEHIIEKGLADNLDAATGDIMPMITLVDQIISASIKKRATDIHIEPEERILRVRTRVDGVLSQDLLIPKSLSAALTARIKIISDLDITEKRLSQDGRASFKIGSRVIDLRISTMPTSNGEAIVIRILDKLNVDLKFDALGFMKDDEDRMNELLKNPNGLLLVTGPTGSGKTSTLYSALSILNTMDRSILTLEDPIEFNLQVIRQTQVHPDVGMDFPTGLRSILRQDPDIVMVGEIRDSETAELAIRSALTGHLVLSTLHTNNAAGAIPRLVDMGIKPYLLSASLRAVVGQRLVRRICENCKQEVKNPDIGQLKVLGKIPEGTAFKVYEGAGCTSCSNIGLTGRLGLYEIMHIDDSFHKAIVDSYGIKELENVGRANGMLTMAEDGLRKILEGRTIVDEVLKVVM